MMGATRRCARGTSPFFFTVRTGLFPLALIAAIASSGCLGRGGLSWFSSSEANPVLPLPETTAAIRVADLEEHVRALTNPVTEGRLTGTPGEAIAADYLSRALARIGLRPAGDDGTWLHAFDFTAGVSLGNDNHLALDPADTSAGSPVIDQDWRPLAFSRSGEFPAAPIVFVGYGLVVPESDEFGAVDEYGEVDVTDQWVMILRDLPQTLDDESRRYLRRRAGLRYKAMLARDRGARGVLFVSGPRGRFERELAPLRFDASLAGTSIAALSITDALANTILANAGNPSLDVIHERTDRAVERLLSSDETDDAVAPLLLDGVTLAAQVDLMSERARGTNVVGRLQVGATPSREQIVIGAHFDHLGRGEGSGSLADASERGQIHPGADDNASGTALVLELAEQLAAQAKSKRPDDDIGDRDFVFAFWSGEELGLLGSDAWVEASVDPHASPEPDAEKSGPVAYLNFDMVGRLRESLIVQGLGSSPEWEALVTAAAEASDIEVSAQQDSYVPTDATSFYTRGLPVLSAFTGAHSEYHTPRDTLDLLDLEATVRIGELFAGIARTLGRADAPPIYRAQKRPASGQTRGGFRVFLGTIPDYARTDVVGVLLSGVAPEGPAQQAGLRRGDLIIEVAGRSIENLYDYTFALEAMRVGDPVEIIVMRGDERLTLEVVPGSRD